MTGWDAALLIVIGIWLTAAVAFMRSRKKKGRCIGCSSASCGHCRKKKIP